MTGERGSWSRTQKCTGKTLSQLYIPSHKQVNTAKAGQRPEEGQSKLQLDKEYVHGTHL